MHLQTLPRKILIKEGKYNTSAACKGGYIFPAAVMKAFPKCSISGVYSGSPGFYLPKLKQFLEFILFVPRKIGSHPYSSCPGHRSNARDCFRFTRGNCRLYVLKKKKMKREKEKNGLIGGWGEKGDWRNLDGETNN